jgi:hypothetical protein
VLPATELGDPGVQPYRQAERGGVGPEVVRDRVLARIRVVPGRKRHPGQPVVLRRGEQAQRVPAAPPAVPELCGGFEHHKSQVVLREVPRHGQAGLAAADDDRVQDFV